MRFKTSPGFLRLLAFESDFRNGSISDELFRMTNVWNRPESRSRRPRIIGF